MTSLALAALVVVVVAIRILRRRSRSVRRSSSATPRRAASTHSSVTLVAAREIRERTKTRMFKLGTVVILVVVGAAIVVPTLNRHPSRPERVAVVGASFAGTSSALAIAGSSAGVAVVTRTVPTLARAEALLRLGDVDVVDVDGREVLVAHASDASGTSSTARFVAAAAAELGVVRAMDVAGLSAAQVSILARSRPVAVTSLSGKSTPARSVDPEALIGDILIFTMLSQYNTWTLMGVMEEKSSRVIEVLLSALRPLQLLGGKVAGIAAVALAQATLVVAFALALSYGVGSPIVHGTSWLALLDTLMWLVVGYGFYSWVYAAAGSMAERQDQVQSLVQPLSLPMIFGYVTALVGASSGSVSWLLRLLAYLPPTAPFAMPVLVGMHAASGWAVGVSVLISLASTVVVARGAAGIYRRAILRTGRRVRWREVVKRT